jgi:purine-binding chemotaxis protein CheW
MIVSSTQQFCTFYLKDQFFGVPVQQVQEVIQWQDTTRVSLVPEVIRGLINLRGQIVMAIDLRRLLQMEERPPAMAPINMVIRTPEGPVSLLADSIGDVVEVDDKTFEDPPQNLEDKMRVLVTGVHKLEQGLMHVLNTEKVCESTCAQKCSSGPFDVAGRGVTPAAGM